MACQSLHPYSIPFLPVWSLGQKPESWTAELQRTSRLCRWKSTLKEGPKTGRRGRDGNFHNNAPAPQPTQDTVCLYCSPTWKPKTTNLQKETGSWFPAKLQIKNYSPEDHPTQQEETQGAQYQLVLGDFCQVWGTWVKGNSTICVYPPSSLNTRDRQTEAGGNELSMPPSVISVQGGQTALHHKELRIYRLEQL